MKARVIVGERVKDFLESLGPEPRRKLWRAIKPLPEGKGDIKQLESRLVPSAKSAATAAVIAASGMWFISMSNAFNFPAETAGPGPASIQLSPIEMPAPMRSSTSAKRTSPWMLARPAPSTRTGPPPRSAPIAPAARKYEAADASPSTKISPGER